MSQSTATQSQSSYFSAGQKSPTENQSQTVASKTSEQQIQKLAATMKKVQGTEFQDCLRELTFLLKQGAAKTFIKHSTVMRKIMNHFTKLSKGLQSQEHSIQVEFKMLSSLSVIAELIRENQKSFFPFTMKFLKNLFLIDENCLIASPHRKNILAILGVIYENLSRQVKLVQKYELMDAFKSSLLGVYGLIDQLFTLKTFNKSIFNLVNKGVIFTNQELMKNQIFNTVSLFVSVQPALLQVQLNKLGFGKTIENSQQTGNKQMIVQ